MKVLVLKAKMYEFSKDNIIVVDAFDLIDESKVTKLTIKVTKNTMISWEVEPDNTFYYWSEYKDKGILRCKYGNTNNEPKSIQIKKELIKLGLITF